MIKVASASIRFTSSEKKSIEDETDQKDLKRSYPTKLYKDNVRIIKGNDLIIASKVKSENIEPSNSRFPAVSYDSDQQLHTRRCPTPDLINPSYSIETSLK